MFRVWEVLGTEPYVCSRLLVLRRALLGTLGPEVLQATLLGPEVLRATRLLGTLGAPAQVLSYGVVGWFHV